MKLKRWLRHLTVSGPHVAIRPQLPWPLKAALGLVIAILVVVFALSILVPRRGGDEGPDRQHLQTQLERTHALVEQVSAERDRQAALAVQRESQLQIERASQQQLQQQMKALEEEVARLKSDLSFFESLLPTGSSTKGVAIRSFRLQPDEDPNRLRYRLLVQQNGKPERDFNGHVELVVNMQHGGRGWVLQLPDPAAPEAGPAPLSFRHYQRIEGTFVLPTGAVVRSVSVKIHSAGETHTQQTFSM